MPRFWNSRVVMEVAAVSQSDPADEALATIASILDQGEPSRAASKAAGETPQQVEEAMANEDETPVAPTAEADGYSKLGPGPMEAIRFRWTVRRADDGAYYVDETIGANSVPVTSGPMSAE